MRADVGWAQWLSASAVDVGSSGAKWLSARAVEGRPLTLGRVGPSGFQSVPSSLGRVRRVGRPVVRWDAARCWPVVVYMLEKNAQHL